MRTRWLLRFVRVWLPVLVVLAGLIAIAVDPTANGVEGAAHIIGAGLAIWLLNLLTRIGFTGDRERDEEAAARAYFDEHGRWPDEEPRDAGSGPTGGEAPRARRSPGPHREEPPARLRRPPRPRGGR